MSFTAYWSNKNYIIYEKQATCKKAQKQATNKKRNPQVFLKAQIKKKASLNSR